MEIKQIFIAGLSLVAFWSCQRPAAGENPSERAKRIVMTQIDSMRLSVDSLSIVLSTGRFDEAQHHFMQARRAFKQVEAIVEFYFAGASRAINGPAIDKADEHDDKVNYATGFQVVEELLFPEMDTTDLAGLKQETAILKSCVVRIESLMRDTRLIDQNIFQAVRLEVLRIMSLGISGFDSPVAFASLSECDAALTGMYKLLVGYAPGRGTSEWHNTSGIIETARQYLNEHQDFNTFDRAEFILRYLNPLSGSLFNLQKELGIADNKWPDAVNMSKENFFERDVFRIDFFTRRPSVETNALVGLGQVLFFDPLLSGNNKRACASCHQPERAFTDGKSRSVAFDFKGAVERNAPTLINAAFQRSQFWDQRVSFVEDQVSDVVGNREEMHHSLERATVVLNSSGEYVEFFSSAFGKPGEAITPAMIRSALAAYIQSLNAFDSKFDRFMRDSSASLTKEEINGFNLFMGKAKCGTCHFIPLFNGSVPPLYAETESEVLGVPLAPDTTGATLDRDQGKYNTYPRELFRNAFKTPTVRNAELTAPYMHNGVYSTLEQVIDFYNRGGGAGIGIVLSNQTLPTDKLNLSEKEQRDIIRFIHTLTDTASLTGKPARLPRLADEGLNGRTIGGEY